MESSLLGSPIPVRDPTRDASFAIRKKSLSCDTRAQELRSSFELLRKSERSERVSQEALGLTNIRLALQSTGFEAQSKSKC